MFNLSERLSIGGEVSYIFGNISDESSFNIDGFTNFSRVDVRSSAHNYFNFKAGANYGLELKSYAGKSLVLDIAGTMEFSQSRLITETTTLETRVPGVNNFVVASTDTLDLDKIRNAELPTIIQVGINIGKFDSAWSSKSWSIGIDLEYQDWSSVYKRNATAYKNAYSVNIGGLFNNNTYVLSGGAYYKLLPYEINGNTLTDFGVTLGTSLNLYRRSQGQPASFTIPYINLGLNYGQRGTISEHNIRENYFTVYLGVNMNQRWFIRKRIN